MTVHQSAIAIIAPDGNRVVGLSMAAPLKELKAAIDQGADDPRITRNPSINLGPDWPFRFDRVYVAGPKRWRSYKPDNLPLKHWRAFA